MSWDSGANNYDSYGNYGDYNDQNQQHYGMYISLGPTNLRFKTLAFLVQIVQNVSYVTSSVKRHPVNNT